MKLSINSHLDLVKPSIIREMKSLADTYDNVIDFTLGEPHISKDLYHLIANDLHETLNNKSLGYSNHYGLIQLRHALSEYCRSHYQLNYNPMSEIIITTGCSESLSAVLRTLIEPGDEIIIFEPAFPLYKSIVEMCGGKVVTYSMIEHHQLMDEDALNELLTEKTKALIVNSPNNPTGHVLSEQDLDVIYRCIEHKPIFIVSDEIYRDILFDQKTYDSFSKFEMLRDRLFILNGVSKSFAMTGWRIGYILGPEIFMKTVAVVHQNLVACASTISQYAALEALNHPEMTEKIKTYYEKNRNYIYEQLAPYFKDIIYPQGAFYLYLKLNDEMSSSMSFSQALLKQKQVATVPAVAFETIDSGYIRLSYCCDFEILKEGILRIQNFIKNV